MDIKIGYSNHNRVPKKNNLIFTDSLSLEPVESVRTVISNLSLEEKIAQLFLLHISEKMSPERTRQFEEFINKYGVGGVVYDDIIQKKKIYSSRNKLINPLLGVNIWNKKTYESIQLPPNFSFDNSSNARKYGTTIGKILLNAKKDFVWIDPYQNDENYKKIYKKGVFSFIEGLNQSKIHSLASGKTFQNVKTPMNLKENEKEAFILSTYFVGYDFYQTPLQKKEKKKQWIYDIPNQKIKIREDYYGLCLTPNIEKYTLNAHLLKLILKSNDWITFPNNPYKTLELIKQLIVQKKINASLLDRKLIRIINKKDDLLSDKSELLTKNEIDVKFTSEHINVEIEKHYFSTISVERDFDDFLPIKKLDNTQFFVQSLEGKNITPVYSTFKKNISNYVPLAIDSSIQDKKNNGSNTNQVNKVIIIPVFNLDLKTSELIDMKNKKHSIKSTFKVKVFGKKIFNLKKGLYKRNNQTKLIWVFYGEKLNNSIVNKFFDANDILINAPFENQILVRDIPAVIFGGKFLNKKNIKKKNIDKIDNNNELIEENSNFVPRLSYVPPEELGIYSQILNNKIPEIVKEGIKKKAFPGAQVLIARKGKIIYQESFGKQSYLKNAPKVNNHTIYDLASLTKVLTTTQVLMHLQYLRKIDINKSLGYYLDELKDTNKGDLIIKDVLLHRAGLRPIVKVKRLLSDKKGRLKKIYFSKVKNIQENIPLTNTLYTNALANSLIWSEIKSSPLRNKRHHHGAGYSYKYSDLGFILLQKVCEEITKTPLDVYATEHIFNKIGLSDLVYNPLEKDKALLSRIAPTEIDNFFRKGKIHGIVNDPLAAIMNGVAGHAGLFGTALDVAKVMELSRNNGSYGGMKPLYSEEIMKYFNAYHIPGLRRGLGWDKPNYKDRKENTNPVTNKVSVKTFGHLGFTGTCTWVDPENELLFVFLSNRTYPKSSNTKIQDLETRNKILELVYQGIEEFDTAHKLALK